ncbi:MAG TPA: hypothetical protein DDZ51_11655 [Planctomycetaceae bacterium]|nr:hypothetical protein [Planctomycetaceae bacterium]
MLIANAALAETVKMTRVQTFAGKKYFGPVVAESDTSLQMFDIAAAVLVKLDKADLKVRVDNIDELISESYVTFPSYAAWKIGQMTKSGRLEALVVHNSEKGVFFNAGTSEGVQGGQRCVLLKEPETIVDPVTDEVLGVIRERVGVALPLLVRGERLSQVDLEAVSKVGNVTVQQVRDAFTVGRSVEIERPARKIVIGPPKWTPTKDAESLEDEANFLHSHLIAEMVRHGISVISKQQIEFIQKSVAEEQKKPAADVTDIEIAKKANANVMVSAGMLAKGTTIETLLEITNLETNEYAGAILGKSRLKADRKDAARAIAFARGVEVGRLTNTTLNASSLLLLAQVRDIVLNENGEVTHINFKTPQATESQIAFISKHTKIESVSAHGPQVTDAQVRKLSELKSLQHLGLYNANVTDEAVAIARKNHPRLSYINLGSTRALTAAGLEELSLIPNLVQVYAQHAKIDNEGLSHLKNAANLRNLIFDGSDLSDVGLRHLQEVKTLSFVKLVKTKVTLEGIAAFKDALPSCEVVSDF